MTEAGEKRKGMAKSEKSNRQIDELIHSKDLFQTRPLLHTGALVAAVCVCVAFICIYSFVVLLEREQTHCVCGKSHTMYVSLRILLASRRALIQGGFVFKVRHDRRWKTQQPSREGRKTRMGLCGWISQDSVHLLETARLQHTSHHRPSNPRTLLLSRKSCLGLRIEPFRYHSVERLHFCNGYEIRPKSESI